MRWSSFITMTPPNPGMNVLTRSQLVVAFKRDDVRFVFFICVICVVLILLCTDLMRLSSALVFVSAGCFNLARCSARLLNRTITVYQLIQVLPLKPNFSTSSCGFLWKTRKRDL